MPVKYRQNDVFLIPVAGGKPAVGRVILKFGGGNILAVIYPGRPETVENVDFSYLKRARPVFTIETMDLSIKNGTWRVLGNWAPAVELPIPVYKTQFEFGGPFFEQFIDGSTGRQLADDEASRLKKQKSYSPDLAEAAVRALQGLGPWLPVFDEMRSDQTA
ncbi:hypothetical protein [Streptomyces sp. NPDC087859]|uniref:hypothetical protein n=1 Tax=Streptomyces sp. NPDC087859 TaxID=3365812 RepID=UPI00381C3A03